ncbi:unnamed protein product [Sphagnum jensenii]|uniref:VWFA domain-containing protein n=1 Tax=Sphagnum jensenii TaxID=128206 RepID=A0ABP1AJ18_9BRYO
MELCSLRTHYDRVGGRTHHGPGPGARGVNYLLFVCLVLVAAAAAGLVTMELVAGDEGSDFLDTKETQVKSIAIQAQANQANSCELISTCNSTQNCTRCACAPLLDESTQCITVPNNPLCTGPDLNSSCRKMNADYNQSYVTLPPITNYIDVQSEITNAVCTQKPLDETFATMSNASTFTLVYFGSVDGTWRAYPGREVSPDDCVTYDPRTRPGYLTGISVAKYVIVLIDVSPTMDDQLTPFLLSYSYLQASQNISMALLGTLLQADYVNILTFDNAQASPLNTNAVYLQSNTSSELQGLTDKLTNIRASNQTGPSNLTLAIGAALTYFPTNTPQYLKIIIVLTDGQFATTGNPNQTLPVNEISSNKAKVFVYKMLQTITADNDPYLERGSNLPSQICEVNGTFEVISQNLDNPLFAIKSFYSFLANTHIVAVNQKPYWSNVHSSFFEGSSCITVTYPAFDSNGELLGVAGIDVFKVELGTLTQSVEEALHQRVVGNYVPLNNSIPLQFNCSLETSKSNASAESCPSVTQDGGGNGGCCPQTDFTSTTSERACCGDCITMNKSTSNTGQLVGKIVGSIVGGLLVLLIIGVSISYCHGWFCFSLSHNQPEFSAETNEMPSPSPLLDHPSGECLDPVT